MTTYRSSFNGLAPPVLGTRRDYWMCVRSLHVTVSLEGKTSSSGSLEKSSITVYFCLLSLDESFSQRAFMLDGLRLLSAGRHTLTSCLQEH